MKPRILRSIHVLSLGFLLVLLSGLAVSTAAQSVRLSGRIVFASNRDGNSEIYTMKSDGTDQLRLTNNTGVDYHPVWSPDGRRIAYLSQNGSNFTFAIKMMNADGSNQAVITPLFYNFCVWPFQDDWAMSWSPDGRKITFPENGDIYSVNADGTDRVNLTNNPAWDSEPTWSANGSRIIFTSSRAFFRTLYSMNTDGSNVQALPSDGEFWDTAPEYSPAGDRIAFVVNSSSGTVQLYTANADGTNRTPIDGVGSMSQTRNKPKWSYDGTKIAFHMWDPANNDSEIYVRSFGRGPLVQLTNTVGSNFDPSWQPRTLTVISGRSAE